MKGLLNYGMADLISGDVRTAEIYEGTGKIKDRME